MEHRLRACCFWQHVENCRGGKLRTQAGDYSLPERFGEGAEACTFATANPSCGGRGAHTQAGKLCAPPYSHDRTMHRKLKMCGHDLF